MLKEIKEELFKDSSNIVMLLENFGFCHIRASSREIRFARSENGGPNIRIRLENNDYINVADYVRGTRLDIFSYIVSEKNVRFREVLQRTKEILGLSDDWQPRQKYSLFNGIYDNILRPNREIVLKTYPESILDKYERISNIRFLRDGISLDAQKFFDVRFSVEDNAIIIPLRNEYGDLVGAKARINKDPEEGESKYYYEIPVMASQILYGYSDNYQYIYGSDAVLVESEKAVMQGFTFGARNILGIGSHSLSEKQVKLLYQIQPKRIIIAMDEGLDFSQTQRNADMIKSFGAMFVPEIWYWDSDQDLDILPKSSPTDMGKDKFEEIMREELIRIY